MEKRDFLDEVHVRILRVTEDLRAIQQTLNCAAMQAPGDPELMEALCELPEIESLHVLKSALDQMRHFLWFYQRIRRRRPDAPEPWPEEKRREHGQPESGCRGEIQTSRRHRSAAIPVRRKSSQAKLDRLLQRCLQTRPGQAPGTKSAAHASRPRCIPEAIQIFTLKTLHLRLISQIQ
jgi:hypothetical protein